MNKKKKKKTSKKKTRGGVNSKRNALIIISIIILLIALLFILDDTNKTILRSEYEIGENASLDNINLKLSEVNYINENTGIELTFDITNKKDETITIIPDNYFKFYSGNNIQIPNKYNNNINIIKKNETVSYKLQYDISNSELYEIYFYSQTVENNIKFKFKSSDISINDINEINNKNIIKAEEKE